MPLAKGNMWIGTETTFNESGDVVSTRPDTISITDVRSVNGKLWYRSNRGTQDQEIWYRNSEDGLHGTYVDPNEPDDFDECTCLSLHYPAPRGDTLRFPSAQVLLPDPGQPGNVRIVRQIIAMYLESTDSAVTVPAGSYRSHVYRQRLFEPDNAQFVGDVPWHYYVPDIGPVMIEWYPRGEPKYGGVTRRWELVEARLN